MKDAIKLSWYNKLIVAAKEKFQKEGTKNGWVFQSLGNQDFRWYLEEFGPKSLCIRTCYWDEYGLWVDTHAYDAVKIHRMLRDGRYSVILSSLHSIDERAADNDWKIIESGDYYFESIYDGNFNRDTLSWYAGNKTVEFLTQFSKKLDKIRDDENITRLIVELNKEAKR